jgi:hypothetical protein
MSDCEGDLQIGRKIINLDKAEFMLKRKNAMSGYAWTCNSWDIKT